MCSEYLFQKLVTGNSLMVSQMGERPFHDMFQITSKIYLAYVQSEHKTNGYFKKKKKKASISTVSKENE